MQKWSYIKKNCNEFSQNKNSQKTILNKIMSESREKTYFIINHINSYLIWDNT